MKINFSDITSKKQTPFELPDVIFNSTLKSEVLAQYIRVYLHRNRQNTKQVLSRGQITGTTAKVWRQKGTGRARHGSRKAPIFVGGGKAHGPSGEQTFKLTISKRLKKNALFVALTAKLKDSLFVASLESKSYKTKDIKQTLETLIPDFYTSRVTLVLATPQKELISACKNLKNVSTTQAARLNPYEVFNSNILVFTKPALETLISTHTPTVAKTQKTKPVTNTQTK